MSNAAVTIPLPLTYAEPVCVLDCDPDANETTSDLQNLVQDVYHRLIEIPGSNPDDATLGIGVQQLLSGTVTNMMGLQQRVPQQLLEDDRISSCDVSIVQNPDGSYTLALQLGVAGAVLGLEYGYTAAGGLVQTGASWP